MQHLSAEHATSITRRLRAVKDEIGEIAQRSGRAPGAVRLIAVSKTFPAGAIEAACAAGHSDFGESTVQEALPKLATLADRAITWHFIGHLQSNKAKHIPGNFAWLHALDSIALAQRLSRVALDRNATLNALIEVNITGDPRKHGVAPAELPRLLEALRAVALPCVSLRGLMTIGPYPADGAARHAAFAQLRSLRDACVHNFGLQEFSELSMGMSADYREAILEGATMVRVGSAIFGERDYGAQ